MSIQGYDANEKAFIILLLSNGVDVYFNSRTRTHIEIESCTHTHFTNTLE